MGTVVTLLWFRRNSWIWTTNITITGVGWTGGGVGWSEFYHAACVLLASCWCHISRGRHPKGWLEFWEGWIQFSVMSKGRGHEKCFRGIVQRLWTRGAQIPCKRLQNWTNDSRPGPLPSFDQIHKMNQVLLILNKFYILIITSDSRCI